MNNFRSLLCLLGFAIPACQLGAASHLESYLPATSLMLVNVPDYSALVKKSGESPVNDLVNNPSIREVLKPLTDYYTGIVDEGGENPVLTWAEIKKHLSGQILLSLDISPATTALQTGNSSNGKPKVLLLADMKDADTFVKLLTDRLKEQEKGNDSIGTMSDDEKFLGSTIHHLVLKDDSDDSTDNSAESDNAVEADTKDSDKEDLYFGNVDDTFFITLSQQSAHDILDAMNGNKTGTLADTDMLSHLQSRTENSDLYLFINAKPLADFIEASIRKKFTPAEGEAPNPMRPTPDAIINALGMNSIKDCLVSLSFNNDNVQLNTKLAADTSYGVGRLLRSCENDYATPDFVPANAVAVSASGFNASILFTELRQILFSAAPSFQMIYQAQIIQLQQQSGIDIDKDVLGNFDNGFVSYVEASASSATESFDYSQQCFAVKVKDPASFKQGLNALIATTPFAQKLQRRDFAGTEVLIFNAETPASTIALAVKDKWLLISKNPGSIQTAVSSDSQKSFWQTKTYADLGDGRLAPGGVSMNYNDFDTLAKQILSLVARVYNQSAPVQQGEAQPIDTNLIANIKDMPFALSGKAYLNSDGFDSSSYLLKK